MTPHPMRIIICLVAFLGTSAALAAGVDGRFLNGVPNAQWGATLEQIQAAYPGGLLVPGPDDDDIYTVRYAVAGKTEMLGIDAPVALVEFLFIRNYKLGAVVFHFDYSQREAALYSMAEALGQDYTTCDTARDRQYYWKPGQNTFLALHVGIAPLTWAYLGVGARGSPVERTAGPCR